jgi:hypothetical protein
MLGLVIPTHHGVRGNGLVETAEHAVNRNRRNTAHFQPSAAIVESGKIRGYSRPML